MRKDVVVFIDPMSNYKYIYIHMHSTNIHMYSTNIHMYSTNIHMYSTNIHMHSTNIHMYRNAKVEKWFPVSFSIFLFSQFKT